MCSTFHAFPFTYFICCQTATTEMTRSNVSMCSWNSPAPLAGNTGLYLSRSVSAKQSGWLHNLWTDAGTCVRCTNTCPWYQPLWPATWSCALLTHGKHITKRHRLNGESDYVQAWGKRTSLWTSTKTKTSSFQSQHTTQPALFRATNSLPRKTRCFASVYIIKFARWQHLTCSRGDL